jgi:hypothetical protein
MYCANIELKKICLWNHNIKKSPRKMQTYIGSKEKGCKRVYCIELAHNNLVVENMCCLENLKLTA